VTSRPRNKSEKSREMCTEQVTESGSGGRHQMWLEPGGAEPRLRPDREICSITDRMRQAPQGYEGRRDGHSGYKCLMADASLAAMCTPPVTTSREF
jgi:hypothetical protein